MCSWRSEYEARHIEVETSDDQTSDIRRVTWLRLVFLCLIVVETSDGQTSDVRPFFARNGSWWFLLLYEKFEVCFFLLWHLF